MSEVVSTAAVLEQEALAPPPKKPRKVRAPKHDFKDGRGKVFAHRHVNGGGWVEDSAKVADSAFVGKFAQVSHNAMVENHAAIKDRARVNGNAYIRDNARVLHFGSVGGNAVLYDDTVVKEKAQVFGGRICGNSVIRGDAVVREFPFIRGATVEGKSQVGNYVQLLYSTLYGHVNLLHNSTVMHSTLSGFITVKNTARIISSTLYLTSQNRTHAQDENGHLLITDDVMVVGCSNLTAFLHVKGHTKIVGGEIRMSPEWNSANREYIRAETITTAIFPNVTIRNIDQFRLYNNADITTRSGTAQAVLASLPPQRQPFDFTAATRRRVMSTGDNT